jgi:hypothetical protein
MDGDHQQVKIDKPIVEGLPDMAWYYEFAYGSLQVGWEAMDYGAEPVVDVKAVPAWGYDGLYGDSGEMPYVNVALLSLNELQDTLAAITDERIDMSDGATVSQLTDGRIDMFVTFASNNKETKEHQEEFLLRSLKDQPIMMAEFRSALNKRNFAYIAGHLLVIAADVALSQSIPDEEGDLVFVTPAVRPYVRHGLHEIFCQLAFPHAL